jgi:hypothetical protein
MPCPSRHRRTSLPRSYRGFCGGVPSYRQQTPPTNLSRSVMVDSGTATLLPRLARHPIATPGTPARCRCSRGRCGGQRAGGDGTAVERGRVGSAQPAGPAERAAAVGNMQRQGLQVLDAPYMEEIERQSCLSGSAAVLPLVRRSCCIIAVRPAAYAKRLQVWRAGPQPAPPLRADRQRQPPTSCRWRIHCGRWHPDPASSFAGPWCCQRIRYEQSSFGLASQLARPCEREETVMVLDAGKTVPASRATW